MAELLDVAHDYSEQGRRRRRCRWRGSCDRADSGSDRRRPPSRVGPGRPRPGLDQRGRTRAVATELHAGRAGDRGPRCRGYGDRGRPDRDRGQETPELLALADGSDLVAGVVGWTDLSAPDIAHELAGLRGLPAAGSWWGSGTRCRASRTRVAVARRRAARAEGRGSLGSSTTWWCAGPAGVRRRATALTRTHLRTGPPREAAHRLRGT